jgi:hypothetical protein
MQFCYLLVFNRLRTLKAKTPGVALASRSLNDSLSFPVSLRFSSGESVQLTLFFRAAAFHSSSFACPSEGRFYAFKNKRPLSPDLFQFFWW